MTPSRRRVSAFVVCFAAGCGGSPSSPEYVSAVTPSPAAIAVLVGSGDIAKCGSAGTIATAKLLDSIPGTVFTTGDNVYDNGTASEYRDCYAPTWGRHKNRTRPVPGNHEYNTPGAKAYFDYFGEAAGFPDEGYYSYRAGNWLVLALNSEIDMRPGSPQLTWLTNELRINPTTCAAAYFHRPLFSSGPHGNNADVAPLWRVLQASGVEVIIAGHDHLYERFARLDADGRPDPRGIRQFVVGTGGGDPYQIVRNTSGSEARGGAWGVLKLTLAGNSYSWEFIPVAGASFRDSGTDTCQ